MDEEAPKLKISGQREDPLLMRNQRIIDTRNRLYSDDIPLKTSKEIQEQIVVYVAYLKAKYYDYKDRRVFHLLASSDIPPESEKNIIEIDFPGRDSVENFLNSLARDYLK